MSHDPHPLCSLADLCRAYERFGLTRTWLRREADAGRIPCFRAGRRLLFDPKAVEAALIERAQTPESTRKKEGKHRG